MSTRHFTEAQIEEMAANPYTIKVTPGQISFTKAFKELFARRIAAGEAPADIIDACGYDPETLGKRRIESIAARIRKEAASDDGFQEGRRPYRSVQDAAEVSTDKRMKLLETRMEYLEEQMEFVKECMSRRTGRKQVQS